MAATDVVSVVRSCARIFVHGGCAWPTSLVEALVARTDLTEVSMICLQGGARTPAPSWGREPRFRLETFLTGGSLRETEDHADIVPVMPADIPALFASRALKLDVAMLQLSPPDAHGLCSLGTSCDIAWAAAQNAGVILAEINEQMPRTHGKNVIPFDRIHAFVATDRPLLEFPSARENTVEARIADLVAGLVEDGATLQLGAGGIPEAVLARLHERSDLGVHTASFTDRLVELVEFGAVTNRLKAVNPGVIATSFVQGTRQLFDFVHDNPLVAFHPSDWINDPSVIRQNPKVVAINVARQIDLTGQVSPESGVGGQMDFMRGAALSVGGKPVIALPSTAEGGRRSRLVLQLDADAGVITPRACVHWVVTEYGAVNLHGKSLRERAEALLSLAHPDHRAELARDLRRASHFPPVVAA